MRSIRLCQGVAVAVVISALLAAGVFGLGLAIQYGVVAPPTLDLRHSGIGIAAYCTNYVYCPLYTQCPPQSVAPPEEVYVVWSIYEPPTADQVYGRTAHRCLSCRCSADWTSGGRV